MCEALMKRIKSGTVFRAQGLGLEVWQNLLMILRIVVKFWGTSTRVHVSYKISSHLKFSYQRPILLFE